MGKGTIVVFLKHVETTNSSKRLNMSVLSKCIAQLILLKDLHTLP